MAGTMGEDQNPITKVVTKQDLKFDQNPFKGNGDNGCAR